MANGPLLQLKLENENSSFSTSALARGSAMYNLRKERKINI